MADASPGEGGSRRRRGLLDSDCRAAKPRERAFKLTDGGGLYLLVTPNGSKLWRFKYRVGGREKLLALGAYASPQRAGPTVSLKEARERRDEAKRLLRNQVDPMEQRRDAKAEAARRAGNTFESIAREWIARSSDAWSEAHATRVRKFLEQELFPRVGPRPIDSITAAELHAALRAIEARGAIETAQKTRQYASAVFDYSRRTRNTLGNPAQALRRALKRRPAQRYKFLSRHQLGPFLLKLAQYPNDRTRIALRLALLTAVRPGEARGARWSEFDLEADNGPIWCIPAARMKRRQDHVVPLSRQAAAAVRELAAIDGSPPGALLFRSASGGGRPISENTLGFAVRRMGFDATAHGFRHTFATAANEAGYRADLIERQLANEGSDKIRTNPNPSEWLAERWEMMQWWANELDRLESGAHRALAVPAEVKPAQRIKRAHRGRRRAR